MRKEQGVKEQAQRGRHAGRVVLAVIFGVSIPVGALAYWRFSLSERYLTEDLRHMQTAGATLSAEECVDETVAWAGRCRAMKSLCDASVERMTKRCLAGRDRRAYCQQVQEATKEASFGYVECQARGVDRKTKKACGLAYRAVASHCEQLRGSALAQGQSQ